MRDMLVIASRTFETNDRISSGYVLYNMCLFECYRSGARVASRIFKHDQAV